MLTAKGGRGAGTSTYILGRLLVDAYLTFLSPQLCGQGERHFERRDEDGQTGQLLLVGACAPRDPDKLFKKVIRATGFNDKHLLMGRFGLLPLFRRQDRQRITPSLEGRHTQAHFRHLTLLHFGLQGGQIGLHFLG
jgi:hypothetical protein